MKRWLVLTLPTPTTNKQTSPKWLTVAMPFIETSERLARYKREKSKRLERF